MSKSEPEIISTRQVSKAFVAARGTVKALDGISFSVKRGEFVTIVGPSGCGKSTLLQILAGLIPPSSGQVVLGDKLVHGPNPDQVCVVFQDPWLLPWKTAIQNVEFPLQLRGIKAAERHQRA